MKVAIAIPARYGSTRFPGKPLAMIKGKTMLERVVSTAHKAAAPYGDDISVFVTTEDRRIQDHAKAIDVPCIMTPPSCATGSDRVLSALRQLDTWPEFVINLQGDAPFTPPSIIQKLIETFKSNPKAEVVTPVCRLSWDELDNLRESKKQTPFSGTTAIINEKGRALWFSKYIIPAIRGEDKLREKEPIKSPVHQHIGLYGFRSDILEKFCTLEQGAYEQLEGLEQLRLLENGFRIDTVPIDGDLFAIQSGIDSPEDITRAEEYLTLHGEPI